MERVADYLIRKVYEAGARHFFLITGRGILYLTDALAKNQSATSVSTYHEQGASYAAMAYASVSDGVSACLVSTGCASTNAVTACLCAYQDNLPIIFISGNNQLSENTRHTKAKIRTYGSQESDIISVVSSITKYAVMIEEVSNVSLEIEKAVSIAMQGRKGPVWIDVPLDVQNMRLEIEDVKTNPITSNQIIKSTISDINYVKHSLLMSKRPIILVGGGVRSSNATEELKAFVEKYRIPVVFSTSAADIYGSGNELSIGAIGSLGGSRAGNFALQNSDFVLAIGTKLCSQSIGDKKTFVRKGKICAVDIDENEQQKNVDILDKIIISDAKVFLKELDSRHLSIDCKNWTKKCIEWKKLFSIQNEQFVKDYSNSNIIDLYYFASQLSEVLPNDGTVITDAGLEELIIPSTIRFSSSQKCLFPAAQGAMGYAIPAIIGAHFAGRKNIVCVVGDGSFMMNMQEVQVIKYHHIPAKIFVINNNMYAVIRKRQKDLFRTRTLGNDPSDGVPAPCFENIANCFGFKYTRIENPSMLQKSLKEIVLSNEAIICEVMCTPDQKYFHTSFAFDKNKRLVKRPLEDLSPFLDRDLFYKEMIIEPLEE